MKWRRAKLSHFDKIKFVGVQLCCILYSTFPKAGSVLKYNCMSFDQINVK
jgi:hypothetical protein